MNIVRKAIGVGLGALVVGGVVWLRRPQPNPRAEDAPNSAAGEVVRLRADLDALTQSVRRSEAVALTAIQGAANSRAADAVPTQKDKAFDNGEASAEARAPAITATQMRDRVNEQFRAEPIDPVWSRPATKLLDGHIREGIASGSRLLSVECRQTVCRIESEHASVAVYQQFVDNALLFPNGGWDGPVMTQVLNPGEERVKAIAFFLRPGEEFERMAR